MIDSKFECVTQKENVRKTMYIQYFANSEREYHFPYFLVRFSLNRGKSSIGPRSHCIVDRFDFKIERF